MSAGEEEAGIETRDEKRLRCWESVIEKGRIEAQCPVCLGSTIRYHNTSGTTFQQMHVVAARHGGPHESWNLVPGCGCNQNMRHQNLVDWMGVRGNKRSLLRNLFLRKYKSLVPPRHRSLHDAEQVLRWVKQTYRPLLLSQYQDWLLLLDSDLVTIMYDDGISLPVKHELKLETASPISVSFTIDKTQTSTGKNGWPLSHPRFVALRRMSPQYPHQFYRKKRD
jgi:hypothetical protein